jgi:2,3-bisphosphoglycerate-independent phosphoglycerate mutase
MLDDENHPHTSHTTNPVPFVFISANHGDYALENGALNDIAPSILKLFKIAIPQEMDGKNLIINKN